jgi:hypothetical protein
MRALLLLPLGTIACSPSSAPPPAPPPAASVSPAAPAPSPKQTTFLPYMPPGGCAIATQKGPPRTAMISTETEFRDFVRCEPGSSAPFDSAKEWLAVFTLTTQGGSVFAKKLRDDGKRLTLDVDVEHYCGGVAPPRITHRFIYRVPPERRELAVNRLPNAQPPCPPGIP